MHIYMYYTSYTGRQEYVSYTPMLPLPSPYSMPLYTAGSTPLRALGHSYLPPPPPPPLLVLLLLLLVLLAKKTDTRPKMKGGFRTPTHLICKIIIIIIIIIAIIIRDIYCFLYTNHMSIEIYGVQHLIGNIYKR